MPYSVGGHPAFAVDGLNNYALGIPGNFHLLRHVLEGSYLSGETEALDFMEYLSLKDELFSKDAIVLIKPPFKSICLEHKTKGPVLTMHSENWEALGIWTKEGAPFICIEPWWGYADTINTSQELISKPGIHLLAPGKTENLSYLLALH